MSLQFQKGALNDYNDGYSYYQTISVNLAEKFENDFWETIKSIKKYPLHYQMRYRNVRISFLQSFPFGIHYIVGESTVNVLRILHTSRFVK